MSYLFHIILFTAVHLGSLAVIAGSAWVFGETLLRRLHVDEQGVGRWALAATLGLGLIAQTMFMLGVLGLFQRWTVLGLLVAAHLPCHPAWRSTFHDLIRAWRSRRIRGAVIALALVGGAPFVLMALYPPTGWDATVYHLPYVKAFAEAQRLTFVPELRFPVFPQVAEMGFLVGYFLSGVTAAKLTQTLCVFLTAGFVFAWGKRFFSDQVGTWAAALWLGTPLVVWIGSLAYVDIELSLFVTAAFYSWERWREGSRQHWIGLAGAFAGLAASTKYLGLFFCVALFVMTAVQALKRRKVQPILGLTLAAALCMAPWYLRNLYYTGNPVFPFYTPIFGESEWTSFHDRTVLGAAATSPDDATRGGISSVVTGQLSRIFDGLAFLILVPWNGIFHRELFHHQAPLTPFYIVLLPLCVPFALAAASVRRLLGLTGAYALFWLATVQDLRFLLPVFPLLNLALAFGMERWALHLKRWLQRVDHWRRVEHWTRNMGRYRLRAVTALLLFFPGFFYAGYKINQRGPWPVTAQSREDYLSRQIPGYDAIRWLNETEGTSYTVYGLLASRLCYYADGRFLGDQAGPYAFHRVLAVLDSSPALHDKLRAFGARFLIVNTRVRGVWPPDDRFFSQRFRLVWSDATYALYELL